MKIMVKLFTLLLLLFGSKCLASEQNKNHYRGINGAEPISVHSLDTKETCYLYQQYVVKTTASDQRVGEEIKIYRNSGTRQCSINRKAPFFTIKNNNEAWARYFFGIADTYLFIDSGTGPDYRTIYVYDLTNKTKVFEGTYARPILYKNKSIVFQEEFKPNDNEKPICPDAGKWENWGLTVAYERTVIINLETKTKKITADSKCAARQ